MAKIGVVIETEEGQVKATNHGVLTAASQGGANEVIALMLTGDPTTAAAELGTYGASRVVGVSAESGDAAASPDLATRVLAAAVTHFGLEGLYGLASAGGRDLFARLAADLDQPLVSDCVSVDFGARRAVKSHFSGKTMATLILEGAPVLAALRPNAVEAVAAPCEAQVDSFSAPVGEAGHVRVLEVKAGEGSRMDLTEANVIITGGRPIASADNYAMLEECAALLGAAVGASRAAVDAGFAPHSMQVGQTGKTVSPSLYIGCGLSGSVQHFAGMKTSKVIVAVNTDKDAPIFQKCDYGILGDMFEVVPALTAVLKEQ